MNQIYWSLSARLAAMPVALAANLTVSAIAISYIVMHGLHAPASNIGKQLTP